MNQVALTGRLTQDPEVRWSGDMAISNFTIAVERKKKGGDKDADFIRCKAFYKIAENMERYCFKGQKVAVSGAIQTGSYQHRDGYTVYTTDVMCNSVEFLEFKQGNQDTQRAEQPRYKEPVREELPPIRQETISGFEAINDDSIPF